MKKIIVLFSTVVFLFTSAGMSFAKTLKASHQWPGTKNAKTGKYDARHEMVQIIADDVKKAQENALEIAFLSDADKQALLAKKAG